jgi:hypothetical protein
LYVVSKYFFSSSAICSKEWDEVEAASGETTVVLIEPPWKDSILPEGGADAGGGFMPNFMRSTSCDRRRHDRP